MHETKGVWVLGQYDMGFIVNAIHVDLESAVIDAASYEELKFWPFGERSFLTAGEAKEQGWI